ncbi:hypothetical protein, partial [Streptomyces sp. PSKA30]|uniref:hypothetical protein n=1 Tax=Streptomyces sp. PSKA30 TaxID=2874597 RepID=UPI001CD185DF
LARFSPVLERTGSRGGRRPIGAADAEWSAAERSALDAGRGSTTLAKKRAARRQLHQQAPTAQTLRWAVEAGVQLIASAVPALLVLES